MIWIDNCTDIFDLTTSATYYYYDSLNRLTTKPRIGTMKNNAASRQFLAYSQNDGNFYYSYTDSFSILITLNPKL